MNYGKEVRLLASMLLGLASACGGDDDEKSSESTGSLIDAAVGPAADGGVDPDSTPTGASSFAVVTQIVASADQATSYISLTDTLEGGQKIGTEGGQQVIGRALAANLPGSGTVFVGSASSPDITRYELKDGKLEATGTVSLREQGVASIGEYAAQLQILSPTQAYYFDTRSAKIIVWNPTTLAVTTSIDIKELVIPDALLTFTSTSPVRRGTQLVMPVGWRSGNNQRVIQQAAVVVVDTTANAARILRDERCGYVRDAAEAADGRIYLATEAWGSSVHRVNEANAPKPCLLRLKADLSGFDEAYHQDLNAIAGGTAGSLVQARSGKTFVRVLDEKVANVNAMTVPRALASTPAWGWAEIVLGDVPTATPVTGAPLGTGSLIVFDTQDKRFVAEVKNGGTEIFDLTQNVGSVAASTTGLTFSAVQLR